MNKLFEQVKEGTDGRGRVVFICKDANGLYVYKPQTGYKSKHYSLEEVEPLTAAFDRQCGCNHQHAFYEDHERPAADEQYPLPGEQSAEKTKEELAAEKAATKAANDAEKAANDAEKAATKATKDAEKAATKAAKDAEKAAAKAAKDLAKANKNK